MGDLEFDVQVGWSGTGREGLGTIDTDDLVLELSTPASMGGRGVGTNPEELLVSAVAACYTATLFGVLRRARLSVSSLAATASGTVTGFPGRARFERIAISPTIVGGDTRRRGEYEDAANLAHDRCFIGATLAPEVAYEVGSVQIREPGCTSERGATAPAASAADAGAGWAA
jgi:peroxiredoxin-like protein